MPGQFLTKKERERLNQFPTEIPQDDLITFFTLTPSDLNQLPKKSADYNRLGFALQLCALRYMGFCPDDLQQAPPEAVTYTANQIGVDPKALADYGKRDHTRTDHQQKICNYLGFRRAEDGDLQHLSQWLLHRALEHDQPTLLFQMAADWMSDQKVVRPGVTVLERMVVSAREQTQEETYHRLNCLITEERKVTLDQLLITDETTGRTPLFWLRRGAVANTPDAILETLEKLKFLRAMGVDQWDLHSLNPNRQKFLAQIGRRSTNQALQRMNPQRRYPILLAFLRQSLVDITDELIDLFDRCLSDTYARARQDYKEFRLSIAKTTNEKLILFFEMGQIVLDSQVSSDLLRATIYSRIPEEELREAIEECDEIIRPQDDQAIDYFASRYSYVRKFAPQFLDALQFYSHQVEDPLILALEELKTLNALSKRKVREDAPLGFVTKSWLPYVLDEDNQIIRRYYELCALWELRNSLRSGDIWVDNSRRYADPETYLIPKDLWPTLRSEACRLLGLPQNPQERLSQRKPHLEQVLSQLDRQLAQKGNVRIEKEQLVFSPLEAEALPLSSVALQDIITHRLPRVDLTDLLIEVDGWTSFTDHFEHAGGSQPRTTALLTHLYASILAQACNFGMKKMAEISELTYDQLAWCTNWYIREETLQAAINTLVNFQYHQPLSHFWGGGTMSSSDGQRFPVPVKARNATANPRYFGYGRGLTFMSWTSDQLSQYGSRAVPTTVRDATYVLDAIMDNETELTILEHTTDTAGYTEMVFALFDLLGMQFSPRIRDIGDQHLYRIDKTHRYQHLDPIIKGQIHTDWIMSRWDDMLRVAASIKLGWVTASLLMSKFQSYPRQNALAKTLQEYGRLIKSIYIPTYLIDPQTQRRVGVQLNKGEALHNLRRFLLFANEGKIRKSQLEDQANQASALTLVTNAVIVWNTRYIQAIIDQMKAEGYPVNEKDLIHISPCRFDHINKYGKYFFNVEQERNRKQLRPLRLPNP